MFLFSSDAGPSTRNIATPWDALQRFSRTLRKRAGVHKGANGLMMRHRKAFRAMVRQLQPLPTVHSLAVKLDTSPDTPSLVGRTIDGKFTIRSLIGIGGTSLVYDAWHEVLQHPIAVKVLRPEFAADPELAAHFSLEGRVTAQLCGPHVVRVLDTGSLDGETPYTVMERLRGESVADLLSAYGALPPALALELAIQACDALVEAHAHGIVHRDIKPDNLYIVDLPNGGQILKVIDFGIAQGTQIPTGLRKAGVGSAGYMAPEQIVSPEKVDWRADVWAIGVVLFEMLTARLPFRGTTVEELLASAQRDEPLPIEVAAQGLPHELYTVVDRCLTKDPHQRGGSMRELQAELERLRPQIQACKRAVALPLQLCELGRTLLPVGARGSNPTDERNPAVTLALPDQQRAHRSAIHRRSADVHSARNAGQDARARDSLHGSDVPVASEQPEFRPHRRWKTKLAIVLVAAVGASLGTGLLDTPMRRHATQALSQSLPLGPWVTSNVSLGEPFSVMTLPPDVLTIERGLLATSALDLARAERDTQAAAEPPLPRVPAPPRPVNVDLSELKAPAAPASAPSLELLTPWARD